MERAARCIAGARGQVGVKIEEKPGEQGEASAWNISARRIWISRSRPLRSGSRRPCGLARL